jgi:hypothetical protein
MWVPKLAAGARPPVGWPVAPSARASLTGAALVGTSFLITGAVYSAAWPSVVSPFLLRVLSLLPLLLLGFLWTANVLLERKSLLMDRYGGRWSVLKLLASGVLFAFLEVGPPPVPLPLSLSLSTPAALVYHLAFLAGLHFALGDGSALLQGFGCKWSVPSRWRSCTSSERIVAAVLVGGVGGAVALLATRLPHAPAGSLVTLAQVYLVGLSSLGFSWIIFRRDHTVHLHHYFCVAVLLPLTADWGSTWSSSSSSSSSPMPSSPDDTSPFLFPAAAAALLQGLLLGVFVDGVAVWGMDPLLVPSRRTTAVLAASDCATLLWTHVVPLLASPRRWMRTLRVLATFQELVEGVVAEYAECESGPRNLLQSLTDAVGGGPDGSSVLLGRSEWMRKDVADLALLVGEARTPKEAARYAQVRPRLPLRLQATLNVALDDPGGPGDGRMGDLTLVYASTVLLYLIAGSRELRQLARLHLHAGSDAVREERSRRLPPAAAQLPPNAFPPGHVVARSFAVFGDGRGKPALLNNDESPRSFSRLLVSLRTVLERSEARMRDSVRRDSRAKYFDEARGCLVSALLHSVLEAPDERHDETAEEEMLRVLSERTVPVHTAETPFTPGLDVESDIEHMMAMVADEYLEELERKKNWKKRQWKGGEEGEEGEEEGEDEHEHEEDDEEGDGRKQQSSASSSTRRRH